MHPSGAPTNRGSAASAWRAAADHAPDIMAGRFVVEAQHGGQAWAVIVEPDEGRQLLVVVTAYPVEEAQS